MVALRGRCGGFLRICGSVGRCMVALWGRCGALEHVQEYVMAFWGDVVALWGRCGGFVKRCGAWLVGRCGGFVGRCSVRVYLQIFRS